MSNTLIASPISFVFDLNIIYLKRIICHPGWG